MSFIGRLYNKYRKARKSNLERQEVLEELEDAKKVISELEKNVGILAAMTPSKHKPATKKGLISRAYQKLKRKTEGKQRRITRQYREYEDFLHAINAKTTEARCFLEEVDDNFLEFIIEKLKRSGDPRRPNFFFPMFVRVGNPLCLENPLISQNIREELMRYDELPLARKLVYDPFSQFFIASDWHKTSDSQTKKQMPKPAKNEAKPSGSTSSGGPEESKEENTLSEGERRLIEFYLGVIKNPTLEKLHRKLAEDYTNFENLSLGHKIWFSLYVRYELPELANLLLSNSDKKGYPREQDAETDADLKEIYEARRIKEFDEVKKDLEDYSEKQRARLEKAPDNYKKSLEEKLRLSPGMKVLASEFIRVRYGGNLQLRSYLEAEIEEYDTSPLHKKAGVSMLLQPLFYDCD